MADITLDMINDFFKVSKPIPKAPVVASIRGPPQAPTDKYREPEFKLPKKPYELRLEVFYYPSEEYCKVIATVFDLKKRGISLISTISCKNVNAP